jgi:carboxymethylenebutenolidase
MGTRTQFKAADGAAGGTALEGELAEPAGRGRAPALVLIQEWWGINDHLRSMVDRFAKEGFLVLAPDLYHGTIATSADEAAKLMNALDKRQAMKEIGDAVSFLRSHERSTGKVAVTGFCMGGALAFGAAATISNLAAVVPFYGLPPKLDWSHATAPILAHFAKRDDWATVGGAEEIKRAIDAAGKTTMELHVYDAGHAFMRDSDAAAYDETSAKLAFGRTLAFLRQHAGPAAA